MKNLLILVLLLIGGQSFAQDQWSSWDEKYFLTNYDSLIQSEINYAKKVENDPNEIQYYCRNGGYKFAALSLNESRPVDSAILASMKRVFKLTGGKWPFPEKMKEHLFEINGLKVWAPMQQQLEKPFKKASKKQHDFFLYCAFFNEHNSHNKLYNTLLISEFR